MPHAHLLCCGGGAPMSCPAEGKGLGDIVQKGPEQHDGSGFYEPFAWGQEAAPVELSQS